MQFLKVECEDAAPSRAFVSKKNKKVVPSTMTSPNRTTIDLIKEGRNQKHLAASTVPIQTNVKKISNVIRKLSRDKIVTSLVSEISKMPKEH